MMRKTRNINDIKVAMLAIGVSFVSLFLLFPLVYIFIYHFEHDTQLPDFVVRFIYFIILFLFLLSSASLLLGFASMVLYLYYRITRPKTTKN
jgi:hypothetical protein